MERKTEKHEIQMLNCDRKVKADKNWMIITYLRTLCVPRWILWSRI